MVVETVRAREAMKKDKVGGRSQKKQTPTSATAAKTTTTTTMATAAAMEPPQSPSYRMALKNLFSCRNNSSSGSSHQHHHKCKKLGCSASICNLRDSPRVMQRPAEAADTSPPEPCKRRASVSACTSSERTSSSSSSSVMIKKPLLEINGAVMTKLASSQSSASAAGGSCSSSSSTAGSFRGMHLRRLSGCYECHHMVVDPISGLLRDASMRSTICTCPHCGEIFVRPESLELHQSIRHAVSELGPEDTSRNIIEIIFQSSWLKKQAPVCKVDRILKVHNTQRTLARFEDYRDSIKSKASKLAKKYPRCTADGNELLRFQCTTVMCSLGLNGCTNLCDSIPNCTVCGIIRDGFKTDAHGRIQTMATSGRAHDAVQISDERRAMLVCRVIAGRVKRSQEASEEYDSLAGTAGVYSNLDELFVFNAKAILPCFVVIYTA